jgi:hypothetical protein
LFEDKAAGRCTIIGMVVARMKFVNSDGYVALAETGWTFMLPM